jgi:hypothetical protein
MVEIDVDFAEKLTNFLEKLTPEQRVAFLEIMSHAPEPGELPDTFTPQMVLWPPPEDIWDLLDKTKYPLLWGGAVSALSSGVRWNDIPWAEIAEEAQKRAEDRPRVDRGKGT